MSNLSDPKLILAQAAEAAEAASAILPKIEQELNKMEAAVDAKRKEIAAVRALAERHKPQPNVTSMLKTVEAFTNAFSASVAKTATPDIELALSEAGPISAPDMIAWIKEKTGRDWGVSTVYAQLKKGKDSGRYSNEDNKWSMANNHDIFGSGAT